MYQEAPNAVSSEGAVPAGMLLQAAMNCWRLARLPLSNVNVTALSWKRARFAFLRPAKESGCTGTPRPVKNEPEIRCSLNNAVFVVPSVADAREHTPAVAGTPKAPLAGMIRPLHEANCAGPP